MAITLTNGASTITLPPDLLWPDEFAWTAVSEQRSYSLGGAVLADKGLRLAGRPIVLQGGSDFGWMTRAEVQALKAWAEAPAATMTLSHNGANYSVAFDHSTNAPISATPIADYSDPGPTDLYWAVLRFITIG